MRKYFKMAFEPSIVRRSLRYSIIVGVILIIINHGDNILNQNITGIAVFKMCHTLLVPYIVTTLSSVESLIKADCSKS
ncbi:MAG TPA: hypothetical protein ENI73_08620 [Spirochaetes bacterium]|nr:hypothetical protein [Spirochaetota bacterium]